MAEALAWFQEQWEVAEEQDRYGEYWLISPSVAADVELAINGPSRAASSRPITPAEPSTPRTGAAIAGSCVRCKRHKIRCDRGNPCTNCARLKKQVVCEYKQSHRNLLPATLPPSSPALDTPEEPAPQSGNPQILQEIPQAGLLHAENMLLLSKDLFMNRSPDIPSPWPHWTAYASDQVPEPSIMRTAFNDLHDLAVSVTKRLMQTAIIQATSRLRSQRRRTKKGVMPFVKTRDVLSAIDVLGLKRNARSRWTGVARRCNLRVFDEQRTTRFKTKRREISWDQAEQILGLYDAVITPMADGADGGEPVSEPEDGQVFKSRAARHGTPMPMEQLSLSTSGADAETEDDPPESDAVSSDGAADEDPGFVQGYSTEDATKIESREPEDQKPAKQTLEQFDQQARQQEEEALCKLLGITPTVYIPPNEDELEDETDDEPLGTVVEDWRQWTDYHPAWEEYDSPIPDAKFEANQKPRATLSAARITLDSDASSTASPSPQRARTTKGEALELQPQNPRSYAAMQTSAYGTHDGPDSDASRSDDDVNADVPAQSIEDAGLADAMDWEA
ncbi:hypothetical protein OPT61_g10201 [Boeremia exigua]|uniref:Uncharacterized protein n=1 Tax=Boeremia exigua TaxID=749465 RepID=A0ACC2HRN1_9PLEO|nr:hypothetical protein OPT61_g10201 [Boeremia exigua]